MNSNKASQRIALFLLIALVVVFLFTQTSLGGILLASPWWIFLVIFGILFSAYMSMKYSLEERHVEHEFIEKEGQIYLERIEEEREKRKIEKS
ncbi:hypothetical protein AJ85_07175 [Alkalihalobacillus alcalophilus ATCC 27647 = CGMCC 1.3604]|uniref:Sporulation protein YhaL n=1 Tax=Alkalihalobacillus alcalophilus ATCC 27647 = CGMCC 1.3604 TaxID=1218173 RepID=A0A4V3X7Z1_ALKAL|nr:sporulation YhaL family protein [Alkalihalobacillus alcalophilus]MED1561056.1 sporulation YhaL family protein [Alkalihalobacillus alcalophilus]THG88322.1 hypothetical protein AJ85_07175 [Alkalihalobacillus alcalophilus ATCC 27647 = CGMCC 1.3604]